MTAAEGRRIWLETLRWLWLCGTAPKEMPLQLTDAMTVIDEMWHAFVLFTNDYTDFCHRHFGRYVHHVPTTEADRARFRRALAGNRAVTTRRILDERRAQYERIAEQLGVATLRRWYIAYPVTYSSAALRRLRVQGLKNT